MPEKSSGLFRPWMEDFCIPECRKNLSVPGMRPFKFPHAGKFCSLEPGQGSLQRPTFMAWRNVKCLIPWTGRLFRHLGMRKVFFQGPVSFPTWGNEKISMGGRKNVLVSTAGFSILGNGGKIILKL
jgi:hypothetical protein